MISGIIFVIKPKLAYSVSLIVAYLILFFAVALSYYIEQRCIVTNNSADNATLFFHVLYDKFILFRPTITHFGDTASDIAVLIQFYQNWTKYNKNNIKNKQQQLQQ